MIRASICTGEKVAGFRDEKTGRIEELMLITGEEDLKEFLSRYEVKREEIETVW
ncbi:MAG: aspartate dehydrogenase [Lachnospiraceae bacterium]|nr:aspartate dehydrogenase [Lachnospiraceae bacterium]